MKKAIYLMLLLVSSILLTRCSDSTETLEDQEALIPDTELNIDEELDLEDTEFKDDVFVNGVNQTYLQETGLTEEELLASVEEEQAELLKEIESQYKNNSSATAGKGPIKFDKNELAGAIAIMLSNIAEDPGKYFQAKIGLASGRGPFLDLGLGDKLIRETIATFPEFRKYSSREKVNLYGFSLRSISISGNSTVKIKIRGRARYRRYIKFFGKKRRIINKRLSADLHIPMNFEISTNTLKVKSIKVDKIHITGFIFNPVIAIINLVVKKFVKINRDVNLDVSYDFISKAFVDYKGLYQERIRNQNFTFFKFNIKKKELINTIKNNLKKQKIKF